MFPFPARLLGFAVLSCLTVVPVQAQAPPDRPEALPPNGIRRDYRDFFKKPVTVPEFWEALKFEMDVGRFDLAARHLKGLLEASSKSPDELVKLEANVGMSFFLGLRNVPRWSEDPKLEAQARKDIEELISRLTTAIKARLEDPKRIEKLTKMLSASRDEREYALKELYRAGAPAIPHLIEEMRKAKEAERTAILNALPRLRDDTIGALLAALDIDDPVLRMELIKVFRARRAREAIPYMLYLASSNRELPTIRRLARETASVLLDIPPDRLPLARVYLTAEAERYYQHRVRFPDPDTVTVWRWDGKKLVAGWPPDHGKVSVSKAEEYFGLRFAQKALDLDPRYRPAQVVFLKLALDKAYERAGVTRPLVIVAPAINELLSTIDPDLVNEVLDSGLTDRRIPVILGAAQVLGQLKNPRAVRPSSTGEPPLVRALNYPDRRVQLAAAHALIQTPGSPSTGASVRVVEVLRRAIAAAPGVPVTYAPQPRASGKAARARREAGGPSLDAQTFTEITANLVSWASTTGPANPLPFPAALAASERQAAFHDPRIVGDDAGPKVIVAFANQQQAEETAKNIAAIGFQAIVIADGRDILRRLNAAADIDALVIDASLPEPGLPFLLAQLRADYHAGNLPILLTFTREREIAVTRLADAYRNIWAVPDSLPRDEKALAAELVRRMNEAMVLPMTRDERKVRAEIALLLLARVAKAEAGDYDIRTAADNVLNAMKQGKLHDEAIIDAIEVAGRLPGRTPDRYPQSELVAVLLDELRSVPVRSAAAVELVRHIQTRGMMLSWKERADLYGLLAKDLHPALRPRVANVVGSFQRDPSRSTNRILLYDVPPPSPGAPMPPGNGLQGNKPPMPVRP